MNNDVGFFTGIPEVMSSSAAKSLEEARMRVAAQGNFMFEEHNVSHSMPGPRHARTSISAVPAPNLATPPAFPAGARNSSSSSKHVEWNWESTDAESSDAGGDDDDGYSSTVSTDAEASSTQMSRAHAARAINSSSSGSSSSSDDDYDDPSPGARPRHARARAARNRGNVRTQRQRSTSGTGTIGPSRALAQSGDTLLRAIRNDAHTYAQQVTGGPMLQAVLTNTTPQTSTTFVGVPGATQPVLALNRAMCPPGTFNQEGMVGAIQSDVVMPSNVAQYAAYATQEGGGYLQQLPGNALALDKFSQQQRNQFFQQQSPSNGAALHASGDAARPGSVPGGINIPLNPASYHDFPSSPAIMPNDASVAIAHAIVPVARGGVNDFAAAYNQGDAAVPTMQAVQAATDPSYPAPFAPLQGNMQGGVGVYDVDVAAPDMSSCAEPEKPMTELSAAFVDENGIPYGVFTPGIEDMMVIGKSEDDLPLSAPGRPHAKLQAFTGHAAVECGAPPKRETEALAPEPTFDPTYGGAESVKNRYMRQGRQQAEAFFDRGNEAEAPPFERVYTNEIGLQDMRRLDPNWGQNTKQNMTTQNTRLPTADAAGSGTGVEKSALPQGMHAWYEHSFENKNTVARIATHDSGDHAGAQSGMHRDTANTRSQHRERVSTVPLGADPIPSGLGGQSMARESTASRTQRDSSRVVSRMPMDVGDNMQSTERVLALMETVTSRNDARLASESGGASRGAQFTDAGPGASTSTSAQSTASRQGISGAPNRADTTGGDMASTHRVASTSSRPTLDTTRANDVRVVFDDAERAHAAAPHAAAAQVTRNTQLLISPPAAITDASYQQGERVPPVSAQDVRNTQRTGAISAAVTDTAYQKGALMYSTTAQDTQNTQRANSSAIAGVTDGAYQHGTYAPPASARSTHNGERLRRADAGMHNDDASASALRSAAGARARASDEALSRRDARFTDGDAASAGGRMFAQPGQAMQSRERVPSSNATAQNITAGGQVASVGSTVTRTTGPETLRASRARIDEASYAHVGVDGRTAAPAASSANRQSASKHQAAVSAGVESRALQSAQAAQPTTREHSHSRPAAAVTDEASVQDSDVMVRSAASARIAQSAAKIATLRFSGSNVVQQHQTQGIPSSSGVSTHNTQRLAHVAGGMTSDAATSSAHDLPATLSRAMQNTQTLAQGSSRSVADPGIAGGTGAGLLASAAPSRQLTSTETALVARSTVAIPEPGDASLSRSTVHEAGTGNTQTLRNNADVARVTDVALSSSSVSAIAAAAPRPLVDNSRLQQRVAAEYGESGRYGAPQTSSRPSEARETVRQTRADAHHQGIDSRTYAASRTPINAERPGGIARHAAVDANMEQSTSVSNTGHVERGLAASERRKETLSSVAGDVSEHSGLQRQAIAARSTAIPGPQLRARQYFGNAKDPGREQSAVERYEITEVPQYVDRTQAAASVTESRFEKDVSQQAFMNATVSLQQQSVPRWQAAIAPALAVNREQTNVEWQQTNEQAQGARVWRAYCDARRRGPAQTLIRSGAMHSETEDDDGNEGEDTETDCTDSEME